MKEKHTTKKTFILLITLACFFCGCSKENTANPEAINTLIQTLKAENPDCTCDPALDEYLWENKTVYVLVCGGPACNCAPVYYNAEGVMFNMEAGYTYLDFSDNSSFIKTVWKCH
jgi:hypothetical protein